MTPGQALHAAGLDPLGRWEYVTGTPDDALIYEGRCPETFNHALILIPADEEKLGRPFAVTVLPPSDPRTAQILALGDAP